MAKSVKAVLDGIEDTIHTVQEPIGTEMVNQVPQYEMNQVETHL